MKLKVKKNHELAKLPKFAMTGDAGMDLFSLEEHVIKPGETYLCDTGVAFEIPLGYVGLVWDKGGVAQKNSVKTLGGVLDSGYRGSLVVGLVNLSRKDYKIEQGAKVAQMLIQKIDTPEIIEVEELTATERGEGKHGSTGMV